MTDVEAARSLGRVDRRTLEPASDEVLACAIVRNEVGRIAPWLDHHRALGVDRFLVVDHGSTDGTLDTLLAAPDVHVWTSDLDFRTARFGAALFEVLLTEHGRGHWTVVVDVDEHLVFPDCDERSLRDLGTALDAEGARAYGAVLLDLYADTPLATTFLPDDRSPLAVAHWFDRRWHHLEVPDSGPFENQVGHFGGVRRRIFGGDPWAYCLAKVAVVRFDVDTHLVGGQHWTNLPLASERGALLHFKLTASLGDYAWDELARGQRPPDDEYHRYAEALALRPDLSAFSPTESVRYTGPDQLVALGVIGPVGDPRVRTARADALTAHARDRLAAGDVDRAVGLLTRAADVAPTTVAPLLHLADARRATGDDAGAETALAEACARRPDDLDLLARTVTGPPLPPAWDAATIPPPPAGTTVLESVDATFAPHAVVAPPAGPWVGFVHGVIAAPEHLAPYRDLSLTALVERPAFRESLALCGGLVTFSEDAARFLAERTGVTVAVVPPPVAPAPIAFDPDRHRSAPTVVQPGWWMTRLTTIEDLVVDGVAKVRCAPDRFARLATALARAERRHDGWATDPEPLRATDDHGGLTAGALDDLLVDAVVLADLLDANADPVVLTCLSRAVPVVVPPLPAVVALLGPGYPLHASDPAEIRSCLVDAGRIRAAHEHLRERRDEFTPTRFAAAVRTVWDGGS